MVHKNPRWSGHEIPFVVRFGQSSSWMQRRRGGFEEGKWMGWVDERIKRSIGRRWGGGRRYGLCTSESGVNWLFWIGGGLDVESVRFVQHGDVVGVAQLRGCSHTHKEASSSLTGRWCVVCGVGRASSGPPCCSCNCSRPKQHARPPPPTRARCRTSAGPTSAGPEGPRTEYLRGTEYCVGTVENRAHWICRALWCFWLAEGDSFASRSRSGHRLPRVCGDADARGLVACRTPPLMHR